MDPKEAGRRHFLKSGAALAGLVVAPAGALSLPAAVRAEPRAAGSAATDVDDVNSLDAVLYGHRSRFVTTVRSIEGMSHPDNAPLRPAPFRPSARTPVGDLVGIITPTSLHFTTQHFYGVPDINPAEHKLMVHGLVDRPLVYSIDDLKRLPFVSRIHFVECVGNRPNPQGKSAAETHGRMACSEWTGVPLSVLFKETGLKDSAKWIVAEGSEDGKHWKSVPMSKALDDCFVAYGQNGEPVRPDHGFPLRLLVPGFEGIYNVKWLRRLKVVDQPYLSFQEHQRFLFGDKTLQFSYDYGPKSVITYPSGTHTLPTRGSHVITGVAWSGGGSVRKVEVSVDGGATYKDAEIVGIVVPKAFTRFQFPWKWEGEEAIIQSRCTDEKGQVQPSEAEFAKFWGFTREQLYRAIQTYVGHCNWIQAWKVNRDGRVTNGLAPIGAVADVHAG
jgi:sulfane dehydrogenase subunit SoxC